MLALAAGFGGAVQIAVQSRLGDRVGSLEAVATASLIGAVIALTVLLLARRSLAGVGDAFGSPKWMLLGGVMSALIILAITVAGPRIGIVATSAVLIAAQFTPRDRHRSQRLVRRRAHRGDLAAAARTRAFSSSARR